MTETLSNWQELTTESGSERRHQSRVNAKYPIEVCGFSRHGRYFTERTFTLDVSDGGCKFRLHNEVEKGFVLAIRVIIRSRGQELGWAARSVSWELVAGRGVHLDAGSFEAAGGSSLVCQHASGRKPSRNTCLKSSFRYRMRSSRPWRPCHSFSISTHTVHRPAHTRHTSTDDTAGVAKGPKNIRLGSRIHFDGDRRTSAC